ncbi:MAG: hypothetical protein KDD28_32800, partial [Phaeodactylibacter sp.]|nr:hypothetical protein [Phaeodactylibacter sp.]
MFLAPRSMFAAFGKAESGDATLFEQGILFLATVLTLDKSRKSECGSRNGTGPSATSWPTIVSNLRRVARGSSFMLICNWLLLLFLAMATGLPAQSPPADNRREH